MNRTRFFFYAFLVEAILMLAAGGLYLVNHFQPKPVKVVDGDTLRIGDRRIRLYGIDAPERSQHCQVGSVDYRCGLRAKRELLGLLTASGGLSCETLSVDRYGRDVARCSTDHVSDVGREMVRRGWAVAYERYSSDYLLEQESAQHRGAGLWAGSFENPASYRRSRRHNAQGSAQ